MSDDALDNVPPDLLPDVILDASGLYPPRDGYEIVETDVAFLRADAPGMKLWVAGALCAWVRDVLNARGRRENRHFKVLPPPVERVKLVFGAAAKQVTSEVVRGILGILERDPDARPGEVLTALTGDPNWKARPSVRHLAEVLIAPLEAAYEPLASALFANWSSSATDNLSGAYSRAADCRNTEFRAWLTGGENFRGLGPFPLELPPDLALAGDDAWADTLRLTGGEAIDRLSPRDANAKSAARAACRYFSQHPHRLTPEHFGAFRAFLSSEHRDRMDDLRPKPAPSRLPTELALEPVLRWAEDEYLPYLEQCQRNADLGDEPLAT